MFLKQYVNDKIKEATGIVVYEDKARIYLSIGSKIMMVETP